MSIALSRRRVLQGLFAALAVAGKPAWAGVTYHHYYIVKRRDWHGDTEGTVLGVDRVLAKWGLRHDPVQWLDATGARQRLLPGQPRHGTWPGDVVVRYPGVDTCAQCERIMGRSYYPDVRASERYIYGMDLIVGRQRRVHPGNEVFDVEINAAHVVDVDDGGTLAFSGTVRDSTGEREMSRVVAQKDLLAPPDFDGTWQCALMLDFNKDLPAFFEKSNRAPGVEFRRALEKAFGSELIEIGLVS